MTDPLELPLRDIHLPDPVPFWPLAPGWWILAGILITAVISVWLIHRRKQYLKLTAIRLAREELERIVRKYEEDRNSLTLAREISTLLRRVSISLFPRIEVASLTGEKWLTFLDKQLDGSPFSRGEGRLLAEAPYRDELTTTDVDILLKHCSDWIEAVSRLKGKNR